MEKTRKPVVAGILMLLAGFYMFLILAPMLFVGVGMYGTEWKVITFWILSSIIGAVGVTVLISGIFALVRRLYWFTVIGSGLVILTVSVAIGLDAAVLEIGSFDLLGLTLMLIPVIFAIPAFILLLFSKKAFVRPVKQDTITTNQSTGVLP